MKSSTLENNVLNNDCTRLVGGNDVEQTGGVSVLIQKSYSVSRSPVFDPTGGSGSLCEQNLYDQKSYFVLQNQTFFSIFFLPDCRFGRLICST